MISITPVSTPVWVILELYQCQLGIFCCLLCAFGTAHMISLGDASPIHTFGFLCACGSSSGFSHCMTTRPLRASLRRCEVCCIPKHGTSVFILALLLGNSISHLHRYLPAVYDIFHYRDAVSDCFHGSWTLLIVIDAVSVSDLATHAVIPISLALTLWVSSFSNPFYVTEAGTLWVCI